MKYTVIRDTREKPGQGWVFEQNDYCEGTIIQTMKTGDYTIKGLESILCIERKKTVSEFCNNMFEKRFERELVRLESFLLPFLICEFSYNDIWKWPLGSGLPATAALKAPSKHLILKKMMEFQVVYKTRFILAGPYAKEVTSSLLKRVNEQYGKKEVKSRKKTV